MRYRVFFYFIVLFTTLSQAPGHAQSKAARPFLHLDIGHSAPVTQVEYSRDSAMLITASTDNTVRLWDVKTGKLRRTLKGHLGKVLCLAVSPDGHTLASGSEDGTACLWSLPEGNQKHVLNCDGTITSFAFSPDGNTLAAVGRNRVVRLWNVKNGQLKVAYEAHFDIILSAVFSPDGSTLATGGGDGFAKLWDVKTQKLKAVMPLQGWVIGVAFSPDGSTLAVLNTDKDFKNGKQDVFLATHLYNALAETNGGKIKWTHDLDLQRVPLRSVNLSGLVIAPPPHPMAFSPDGSTLAIGAIDNIVRVFDARTAVLKAQLKGHTAPAISIAFSPDGSALASASWDHTARLWDLQTGESKAVFEGHTREVSSVCFAPNGNAVATGSWDNSARIWNAREGKTETILKGQTGLVSTFATSPDGQVLATGGWDNIVRLWDLQTGQLKLTLREHRARVETLAFSPDGHTLATGAGDGTARLWNAQTGVLLQALLDDKKCIYTLAWSPDGSTLATGSGEAAAWLPHGLVTLWNAKNGEEITRFEGHTMAVMSLAFSPDGKLLASGGYDRKLRLYNLEERRHIADLGKPGHLGAIVPVVAFSPDGISLAAGSTTGFVYRFDVEAILKDAPRAKNETTWGGHRDWVTVLRFSPDGKTIVSGGYDRTVMLRNVASGQAFATLRGHEGPVNFMAYGKNRLATRDANGQVLWWTTSGQKSTAPPAAELKQYPVEVVHPTAPAGAGMMLRDPRNGRVLATLLPLPEINEAVETRAKGLIDVGDKGFIDIGDKAAMQGNDEWFVATPEGYFDCSANAARFVKWNVGGVLYPAERYWRRFRRPDVVRKALRGEKIREAAMTLNDVPPVARFISLQYQKKKAGTAQETVTVALEVESRHALPNDALQVLVNNRPLPPEATSTVHVKSLTRRTSAADLNNKGPIDLGDKPITLGDKGAIVVGAKKPSTRKGAAGSRAIAMGDKSIILGDKAINIGAKPITADGKPITADGKPLQGQKNKTPQAQRFFKRYVLRVPLPLGAKEIRIRAAAFDSTDLGSTPVEVALRNPHAVPVPGNLYALCIGLSRYEKGVSRDTSTASSGATPQRGVIMNLTYPESDAEAMAERLRREAQGFYRQVEVLTLTNEQATLAGLRGGLQWLQSKVRPGQVDTAVIFISGHGLSNSRGEYFFPTHECDPKSLKDTSLAGDELQNSLGGRLRAKDVFLFVDTCHSGALASTQERGAAAGDDLNFEVRDSGVYLLASSGATQRSFESNVWGHGAFTKALLTALSNKEKARNDLIHFDVLTYLVPAEIAKLMAQAGLHESAETPVVPLDGRYLDEPVAKAQP